MSNATLMQLSAVNSQNTHICTDPQISFFKDTHKRHSHFAIETIESNYDMYGEVSNSGDLMSKVQYVWEFDTTYPLPIFPGIPAAMKGNLNVYSIIESILIISGYFNKSNPVPRDVKSVYDLFNKVSLLIGHKDIYELDTNSIRFLHECQKDYQEDIRTKPNIYAGNLDENTVQYVLDVPFYFSQDNSNALPLISLSYHRVNIVIDAKYKPSKRRIDYIYLETPERRIFAQGSNEYNISIIAKTNLKTMINHDTRMMYPTRYIFFRLSDMTGKYVSLLVNGTLRCRYDKFQLAIDNYKKSNMRPVEGFGIISFCVDGNSKNPSGFFNFTRVDMSKIVGLKENAPIYQNYWNILRTKSGMCCIKY